MMKIFKKERSIKVGRYPFLNQDDKEYVDYIIKSSLKPNPNLRIGRKLIKPLKNDFWQLSWNDIVLLRHYISKADIKAVLKLIYNINDKRFLKLDVFNCSACYKWVTLQIKTINDTEELNLASEPSAEETEAGIDKLKVFDYYTALDNISGGDPLKYEAILKLPYSKIFRKMCLDKVKDDIQKQYLENARRKNKGNG